MSSDALDHPEAPSCGRAGAAHLDIALDWIALANRGHAVAQSLDLTLFDLTRDPPQGDTSETSARIDQVIEARMVEHVGVPWAVAAAEGLSDELKRRLRRARYV